MKKSVLGMMAAVALASLPAVSYAQLAFNVGATTDYRYRGISQSRVKPALQGGVDYAAGAFYVGAWASTIKWIKDFGDRLTTYEVIQAEIHACLADERRQHSTSSRGKLAVVAEAEGKDGWEEKEWDPSRNNAWPSSAPTPAASCFTTSLWP